MTDCVRIAPLRVITLNSPLKDSSLWIEYKKIPHPPFTEIHDFLLLSLAPWQRGTSRRCNYLGLSLQGGRTQARGGSGNGWPSSKGEGIQRGPTGTWGPEWPVGTGPEPQEHLHTELGNSQPELGKQEGPPLTSTPGKEIPRPSLCFHRLAFSTHHLPCAALGTERGCQDGRQPPPGRAGGPSGEPKHSHMEGKSISKFPTPDPDPARGAMP